MRIYASIEQEPPTTVGDGVERRVLSYGGSMMLVQFNARAGVTLPEHSHPHEQAGYVLAGELDFFIEGQEPARLRAGSSYYVPAGVRHSLVTHTQAVLLDCFTPQRQDFLPA